MAKSVDEQIKATMAKKVIGQTTEIYKSALTGRSLQVRHSYSRHQCQRVLAFSGRIAF